MSNCQENHRESPSAFLSFAVAGCICSRKACNLTQPSWSLTRPREFVMPVRVAPGARTAARRKNTNRPANMQHIRTIRNTAALFLAAGAAKLAPVVLPALPPLAAPSPRHDAAAAPHPGVPGIAGAPSPWSRLEHSSRNSRFRPTFSS
jgi:hypothetical protein